MTRTHFRIIAANLRVQRSYGAPLETYRSYRFHAYSDGGPLTFVRSSDANSRGTILGIMCNAVGEGCDKAARRAILGLSRSMVRPAPLP